MNNFLKLVLTLIFLSLSFVFVKNALHMFQQQRYELRRYNKWLFNKNNLHFSLTFIYVILVVNCALILKSALAIVVLSIIFAVYFILQEDKKEYIKDLVITNRVKRQIIVSILMNGLLTYLAVSKGCSLALIGILSIYLPYFLIYPLAWLTYPIEEGVKKYYENKARKIINDLPYLKKLGITGSYGKTSTKNIVSDIIGQDFYTLITPASYNTPMGITRTIRGELKPIHEVFVCEMGADKVGDITYLMDFVKPQYGVVTSIGPQHLATFKSMDNIIKEKMQEIEMLPIGGVGFVNLDNEYIKNYHLKNKCKLVSVGIENKDADYVAENIKYSKDGSSFTLKVGKKNYKLKTVLLGQHNITNVLIGIAVALEFGIDMDRIVKNVANIKQVAHRLELKKFNGYNFIDDAFNANPVGCKMALDVLSLMSGTRVIVTPGMIDLGVKQDEINKEFGKYMLNKADFVILVGEKQTKMILQGLKEVNFKQENILVVKNVKEAFDYIYTKFTNKDTILLENDLPDAFNV